MKTYVTTVEAKVVDRKLAHWSMSGWLSQISEQMSPAMTSPPKAAAARRKPRMVLVVVSVAMNLLN